MAVHSAASSFFATFQIELGWKPNKKDADVSFASPQK